MSTHWFTVLVYKRPCFEEVGEEEEEKKEKRLKHQEGDDNTMIQEKLWRAVSN